ncbi:VWA domain-containing protein [Lihuaxuella thermophila]|uniref:Putative glutamine amidotransferase n=1 Tax=Lihuaxuella thermophila TaxID=1173111 RepID=A0A1H8HHG4_9BACL|nr:VWA domain-containing protein [Lihuaxuella thermophila]SEN54958.1 Putative glutamine amidotransferase [Lihuaxuella thermophila]
MAISWANPWMLLLLLPIVWGMWIWWKREERFEPVKKRLIFGSRILIFVLLVFSLARTHLLFPVHHQSVVFVVDRSASVQNQEQVQNLLRQAVAGKNPDDQVAVISVGAESMVEQMLTTAREVAPMSAAVNRNATDLADGLRLAGGLMPAEAKGRVVLITDGKETQGSAEAEARALRERGIRVDVIALRQKGGPEVWVTDLQVPRRMYANEQAALKVNVNATADTGAVLRLYEGNRLLSEQRVRVHQGENVYSFSSAAQQTGFLRYRAEIQPERDTLPNNNQAYGFSQVKGKPVVLVVEGQEGEADNLISALTATGMEVERMTPAALPWSLEDYKRFSSIVLVNMPAYLVPEAKMDAIRMAVRDLGVGLVMSGGENGYGLGGWFQTPIEEALPVHMDIRDKKRMPSLGLMLVIDKSGSMSGEKINLAKEAAIRATEMLSPQDQLGVLAFDDGNDWIFKPQPVKNRREMQGAIGGIPADGGTNIFPALADAYEEIRKLKVKRKHIILLTDGQSPGGQYQELTEKMSKEGITLSTVAVGADADQGLLEALAQWGKGRYYLADQADSIPTIFSKETAMATRSYIVDAPFVPKWTGGSDWFASVKKVPPLAAYVATTPKQTAETVLASPYPDPVLARWQYGLGRAVAWTSDLNGKWSRAWVEWERFSSFWNQVVSWTFPQFETSGLHVDSRLEGNTVHLEAKGSPDAFASVDQLEMTVIDDQLKNQKVILQATAPGQFTGSFPAGRPGTYLLQASAKGKSGQRALGTYGVAVPYSPEYGLLTEGTGLIRRMADAGGGAVLTTLSHAFADNLDSKWGRQDLSLWLLFIAALLWPVDIAVRRISVSREDWDLLKKGLNLSRSSSLSAYTERLGNLQQKTREVVQQRTGQKVDPAKLSKALKKAHPENTVRSSRLSETPADKRASSASPGGETAGSKPSSASDETHLSRLLAAKRKREQHLR